MAHVVIARRGEVLARRELTGDVVRIGRAEECDLHIDDPALSRQHAVLRRDGEAWTLLDTGSENGTHVNGRRVARSALNDRDVIGLGDFTLRFHTTTPRGQLSPVVANEAAFAVFGETFDLHRRTDHDLKERSAVVQAHVVGEGATHVLDRDLFLLGRGEGCQLRSPDWFAPRIAAAIVRGQGGWSVVKLGNRAVTRNGEAVEPRAWLREGDELQIGSLQLVFHAGLPKST